MSLYTRELEALRRAGRLRVRRVADETAVDLASNDYLGFASRLELWERASARVTAYRYHGPRASMLVEGYHALHRELEELLCAMHGAEAGIVVGSGFLANLALLEALPRKGDAVFVDEEFHASGVLASRLTQGRVVFFPHNDAKALEGMLASTPAKRRFVVVEGIYSMGGDAVAREIIETAQRADAVLILDEAHSGGVLGATLRGVLEHYGMRYDGVCVRMGTLGKAYGSYGAYILADADIVSFLENRGKSIIYSTALGLADTALAIEGLLCVQAEAPTLRAGLDERLATVGEVLGYRSVSPIVMIRQKSNTALMQLQERLREAGFALGAIRPPTVAIPALRLIAGLSSSGAQLRQALELIAGAEC